MQGGSARSADRRSYVSGYNTATYGVGLHIFGSNNNVTQAGNIFAKGDAAVGIRLDGLHDTSTVSKGTEVHGDGRNYLVGKKAKRNWLANRKMGASADIAADFVVAQKLTSGFIHQ